MANSLGGLSGHTLEPMTSSANSNERDLLNEIGRDGLFNDYDDVYSFLKTGAGSY